MKRGFLLLKKINVEATIWIIALAALAVFNPYAPGKHFTLCILSHLGFDWCPGCGIGHSISFLLHGDFQSSLGSSFFWFTSTTYSIKQDISPFVEELFKFIHLKT